MSAYGQKWRVTKKGIFSRQPSILLLFFDPSYLSILRSPLSSSHPSCLALLFALFPSVFGFGFSLLLSRLEFFISSFMRSASWTLALLNASLTGLEKIVRKDFPKKWIFYFNSVLNSISKRYLCYVLPQNFLTEFLHSPILKFQTKALFQKHLFATVLKEKDVVVTEIVVAVSAELDSLNFRQFVLWDLSKIAPSFWDLSCLSFVCKMEQYFSKIWIVNIAFCISQISIISISYTCISQLIVGIRYYNLILSSYLKKYRNQT